MDATVVFGHGALYGSWCWQRVIDGLADEGVSAAAVDLPGRGPNISRPISPAESVAVVSEMVRSVDGPVVLCGHSKGGDPISFAALECDNVAHLVYVAAILPATDELMVASRGEMAELARPRMRSGPEGIMPASDEDAIALMFHDCTPDDARWACAQLIAERPYDSAEVRDSSRTAGPWESIPTTYVVCDDDRAVPANVQRRLAARAHSVVELPTGHSPFISRPDLLVELLTGLAHAGSARSINVSPPTSKEPT